MTLLFCVILNGCVNSNEVEISAVANNFKCEFNIANSDLSGEMIVSQNGELKMVFSGPDIINGVGITVAGETVVIDVKGISERYSRNTVPDDSPATYICDILNDIDGKTPIIKNDKITVSGNSKSGEYETVLNGTGFIELITLTDTGLNIHLANHIVLN